MDIKLKFSTRFNLDDCCLYLTLELHKKRPGDKWPTVEKVLTDKVKVFGFFVSRASFPARLESTKRKMIKKFKDNSMLCEVMASVCQNVEKETIVLQDSETIAFLNKNGI